MKIKLLLVLVLLFAAVGLAPQAALAQEEEHCAHDATIAALRECVVHAAEMGHITSSRTTSVLLAQLDAAQAALDRGQTAAAIGLLQSFIRTVRAQAGRTIDAEHAAHLVLHAEEVIAALRL